MTAFLVLLAVGLTMTIAQGAFAFVVPPPWCPDLSLLVVIAVGLYWRGLRSGLLLAVALGFAVDLLSGPLLGTHALVRLFIFIAAWLGSRQLNLRGAVALSVFAAGASLVDVFASISLTGFFTAVSFPAGAWLRDAVIHAGVNALCAGPVAVFVAALLARLDGESSSRRGLLLGREGDTA